MMQAAPLRIVLWLVPAILLFSGCGDEGTEDFQPPSGVTNLAVSATDLTTITLTWTAPGDDGSRGTANVYDLRYIEGVMTDSLWSDSVPVQNLPAPEEAGQNEAFAVDNLEPNTTYSFALRAADEKQNWSPLSNIVTAATVPQSGTDLSWWDGFLYSGLNGPVYALAAYDGGLIAGGSFTEAGRTAADRIAKWNGTLWEPLGAGMNAEVWALTDWNGNLAAGGSFTVAGDHRSSYITMWQGEGWFSIGAGMNSSVLALTVWNGDLIAGGFFTSAGAVEAHYIARWSGTHWESIPGLDGPVYALAVYSGDLVAGGRFSRAGEIEVNQIARWDGNSWYALDSGLHVSPPTPSVSAMTVDGDAIIVGGHFSSAGDVPTLNIASWVPAGWRGLGSGMNDEVYAIALYGGLVAAGRFTKTGGAAASSIARWDGSAWRSLGSGIKGGNGIVYALTEFEGSLFVGGSFDSAGSKVSANIARWDD